MVRPDKPDSSAASRKRARALHALSSFWPSLIDTNYSGFALCCCKIERANALQPVRRLEYFLMTQSVDRVLVAGEPVLFHRPPGELVVFGTALIFLCTIDQVNDVADLFIRLGGQQGHLGKIAQLIGKPLEQDRKGDAYLLCVLVQVYSRPGAARKADLLRPHVGIEKIAWQFTQCVPEIDLERERVSPRPVVEHPLQGRVGNETTIPIVLAIDLCGRKARRQRAAGDDMGGGDPVDGGIEIDEIPGPHVDRVDTQARAAGIDAIKVDQALERGLQRRYIIVADRVGAVDVPWNRRWKPGREEMWGTEQHDAERAGLVEQGMG